MDNARVAELLLADGWHTVNDGTFKVIRDEWGLNGTAETLFACEFIEEIQVVEVCGPLSAVLAMKLKAEGATGYPGRP